MYMTYAKYIFITYMYMYICVLGYMYVSVHASCKMLFFSS